MPGREMAVRLFAKYPPEKFLYKPETRQFKIGKLSVPLGAMGRQTMDLRTAISEAEAMELIDSSALLLQFDESLHLMPKLHKWLRDSDAIKRRAAHELVAGTMIDAYEQTTGDTTKSKFRGSFQTDFNFGISEPGRPEFQVFGNCACLAVAAEGGTFTYRDWPDGYGSFELHNIDHSQQAVALLAGAGALAQMCELDIG